MTPVWQIKKLWHKSVNSLAMGQSWKRSGGMGSIPEPSLSFLGCGWNAPPRFQSPVQPGTPQPHPHLPPHPLCSWLGLSASPPSSLLTQGLHMGASLAASQQILFRCLQVLPVIPHSSVCAPQEGPAQLCQTYTPAPSPEPGTFEALGVSLSTRNMKNKWE